MHNYKLPSEMDLKSFWQFQAFDLAIFFSAVLYSWVYVEGGQNNEEEFNCEMWTPSSFFDILHEDSRIQRAMPKISLQKVTKPL